MDHQFTRQMQEWLNSKHESDAEIIKGADMLFRLNRNRFYHVRATRQPQAYRTNIEYELNKFLKIRLDNMTIEEVRKMNDIVIPEAKAIIAEGEAEKIGGNERISENNGENQGKSEKNGDSIEENASNDDAELPSSDSDGVAVVRKGKRKDHDFLPKEVADLWDINAKRYKEIKSTFETLKAMEDKEPCDRYEYLKILSDLDKKYRADRDRVAKARLAENANQG